MPVDYCGCLTAGRIVAKCAATKKETILANGHFAVAPWNTRNDGASNQDALYGKGNRLFNVAGKTGKDLVCTVCGRRKVG